MDNTCISNEFLRISGIVKESIVDGPGFRYVIFTQGCPHNCKNCHNPETHDCAGGKIININELIADIRKNPLLKGITLSGGEPFLQCKTLSNFINKMQDVSNLDFIVYTGFTFEYLVSNSNENNNYIDLLNSADVLIDGKFEENLMDSSLLFRGSSNQRSINLKESLNSNEVILHNF